MYMTMCSSIVEFLVSYSLVKRREFEFPIYLLYVRIVLLCMCTKNIYNIYITITIFINVNNNIVLLL